MTTKTMKEKATELLQRCEVVTLASVNKEGYPRPVPMSKILAEGISTIWMSTGVDSLKTIAYRIRKQDYAFRIKETAWR